jgi:hypothetical protein
LPNPDKDCKDIYFHELKGDNEKLFNTDKHRISLAIHSLWKISKKPITEIVAHFKSYLDTIEVPLTLVYAPHLSAYVLVENSKVDVVPTLNRAKPCKKCNKIH